MARRGGGGGGTGLRRGLAAEGCGISGLGCDPDQRSGGDEIEQGDEVGGGEVDAAVGGGASETGFVGETVDVDVATEGVHVSAAVEAGFETFEPEDPVGDGGVGAPAPGEAYGLAGLEDRTDGPTGADLGGDAVQSEWGAIGVLDLADSEFRGGGAEQAMAVMGLGVGWGGQPPGELLAGDGDGDDVGGEGMVMAPTGEA